MSLAIYNTLTKKIEDFKPFNPDVVTMYSCGPTVYSHVHIGNYRTYIQSDIVNRVLQFNGYTTRFVMNITDVGHLTGDNEGDADQGSDRMELAAEREGKSVKDIANYYTQDFMRGYEKLNMLKPDKFTKASEYIKEQIELVKVLEQKGFTYKTSDGIYFDTAKYPEYGKLSGLTAENVKEGARVEANQEKKSPTDFALWKFSPKDIMRWQEWNSPWGMGFPGWHLECSAMALKELGNTLDIHIGGEDLKMIHHQNEIAQSECATGARFVNNWVHVSHLQVDDGRMGKSLGNVYTISDIQAKEFDPLALRYFYMTAHYRSKLNFTWTSLQSAQNALKKIYDLIGSYQEEEGAILAVDYLTAFTEAVNEDFNMPRALAVVWELLKSEVSEATKIVTMLKFDEVLGLGLEEYVGFEVPKKVLDLGKTRQFYRKEGIWDKADLIRREIEDNGFVVQDGPNNTYRIKRKI